MAEPRPRRRAAWVAGMLALGIAAAHHAPAVHPLVGFAAAGLLAGVGWLTRGRAAFAACALATVAIGAAWHSFRVGTLAGDHIGRMLDEEPRLVSISGMIVESPRTTREREGRLGVFMPDAPRTVFTLRAEQWTTDDGGVLPVRGRMWVGVGGEAPGWAAGDRVNVIGMARAVPARTNPGEPDRSAWARSRGVGGTIDVDAPGAIRRLDVIDWTGRAEAGIRRALERLRSNARAWIDEAEQGQATTGERQARALLRALLLGQHDADLTILRDAFTRLGISHILSISGLNLAILAGAFLLVLRVIGDRPRTEALLAALAIITYLLVIPARAPVLRAGLMVLAFLAAETSGRRYDRLTILSWVMVIVLIIQPMELFSAGFQLSFGVVAALMTLTRPVRDRLFGARPQRDTHGPVRAAVEFVKDAAAACLVAWAAASPLIAYHVGIFSPLGAPATLLLMPLVTVIMGVGYMTLVAAVLAPAVGAWVIPALTLCSDALAKAALLIDAAPLTVVYLPRLSIAWTVLSTGVLAWWMAPVAIEGWSRRMTWIRWALTGVAAAWLAISLAWPSLPAAHAARLDTIDVADGSCHLLRVRSGWRSEAVLIDCGSLRLSIGERTIPSAIRALGAWRVPTVILTHPDIDHFSAVLDLVQPLGVRRVLVGEAFDRAAAARPDGSVAFVLRELRRRGVEVRTIAAGERLALAGAMLEVISPPGGSTWKVDNDASLVCLVSCETAAGHRRVLMTGDIQAAAIASIVESHPDLGADVMEAPHHGSYSGASRDFIGLVNPSIVVQSTGPRRAGDERWSAERRARQWLSTAEHGASSIVMLRDGRISHQTWK